MTLGVCSHLLFLSVPSLPHLTFIESGFSPDLIDYVSVTTCSVPYCKTQPGSQQWHPSLLILLDYIWLRKAEEGENNPSQDVHTHLYVQALFLDACVCHCVYALTSVQSWVDAYIRISALAYLSVCRAYTSLHASLERVLAPSVMYQPKATVWPSWEDRQDT